MLKELIRLADLLDARGFEKEADYLDSMIKREKFASESSSEEMELEKKLELFRNSIGKEVRGHGYPGAFIAGPPEKNRWSGKGYYVPLEVPPYKDHDLADINRLTIVTEENPFESDQIDDKIYEDLLKSSMSDDNEAIDKFEECLEKFVKMSNPNISIFGERRIMQNMFEHKEKLKNHVTSSDKYDIEAVKEFMTYIGRMAKRF